MYLYCILIRYYNEYLRGFTVILKFIVKRWWGVDAPVGLCLISYGPRKYRLKLRLYLQFYCEYYLSKIKYTLYTYKGTFLLYNTSC